MLQAPREVAELRPSPEPPAPTYGRGFRARAPPQQFKDFVATSAIPFQIPMFGVEIDSLPESPTVAGPSHPASQPSPAEKRRGILQPSQWKKTPPNGFHLYKAYWTLEARPHDPDLFCSDSHEDEGAPPMAPNSATKTKSPTNPYHPFPNWSSFKLGEWYWGDDGGKSCQSFQHLVNLITDEDFLPQDIRHTNWKNIASILASSEFDDDLGPGEGVWEQDGASWKAASISIDVPFNSASESPGTKPFVLEGFRYRPLIPIILSKLRDKNASEHIHFTPSELWWDRDGTTEPIRVYGELYHSDAFLDAYRNVQVSLEPLSSKSLR